MAVAAALQQCIDWFGAVPNRFCIVCGRVQHGGPSLQDRSSCSTLSGSTRTTILVVVAAVSVAVDLIAVSQMISKKVRHVQDIGASRLQIALFVPVLLQPR